MTRKLTVVLAALLVLAMAGTAQADQVWTLNTDVDQTRSPATENRVKHIELAANVTTSNLHYKITVASNEDFPATGFYMGVTTWFIDQAKSGPQGLWIDSDYYQGTGPSCPSVGDCTSLGHWIVAKLTGSGGQLGKEFLPTFPIVLEGDVHFSGTPSHINFLSRGYNLVAPPAPPAPPPAPKPAPPTTPPPAPVYTAPVQQTKQPATTVNVTTNVTVNTSSKTRHKHHSRPKPRPKHLPTLTARKARSYVKQTLLEYSEDDFGQAWDSYAYRVSCARQTRTKQRCTVSWIFGDIEFYGHVTIHYGWLKHHRDWDWFFNYRITQVDTFCAQTHPVAACTTTYKH